MPILKNLRIPVQLAFLTLISLIGFVVIAYTYYHGQLDQHALSAQQRKLQTGVDLTHEIAFDFLNVREAEKDFLLHLDSTYIETHKKIEAELAPQFKELKQFHEEKGIKDLITSIESKFKNYTAQFNTVAENRVAIGLTEQDGERGILNKLGTNILEKLGDQPSIRSLFLEAHLTERNYLTTQDQTLLSHFNEAINTFKQSLAWANLEHGQQVEILENLETYQTTFKELVATQQKIQQEETLMEDLYNQVVPALDKIVKDGLLDLKEVRQIQQDHEKQTLTHMLEIMGTVIASVLLLSVLITRGITRPISKITDNMNHLSDGQLETNIAGQQYRNEIGTMARALEHFRKELLKIRELEAEQEEQKRKAAEQRRAALNQMADSFETSVGKVVETVTSAATELQSSAQQMSATAQHTSQQATTVARASEQATNNVQTVASASEELAASEGEISRHVHKSSDVADHAAQQAQKTRATVENMVDEVSKISTIISLISDITEQTNMLALNATIEAERAGEAGKGFAVVASEVKDLATQTAKATEEISHQVTQVQAATQNAAQAIGAINDTIIEIDQIANSISAAVEEQTAATAEIARNVEEASKGTEDVCNHIREVETAAEETGAAASQINMASSELSRQAVALQDEVKRFLDEVRNDTEKQVLLEWSDEFEIGHPEIDQEHKSFIDMLNDYYGKMLEGLHDYQTSEAINSFMAQFTDHLRHEEEEMERTQYPKLSEHKEVHSRFEQSLNDILNKQDEGEDVSIDFLNYLAQWLKVHLVKDDCEFAQFVRLQENNVQTA